MTNFEQIGGESKLLVIIDEFVERVCRDTMIGFFFARVDRARLKRMEYEHAAAFLGADVPYTGRSLEAAHGRHPILGGHFARRREILRQTLEKQGVPRDIMQAWLAHQDALRAQVTADDVTQCNGARLNPEARALPLANGTPPTGSEARAPGKDDDEERR